MAIVGAFMVPHPPMIVPEVGRGGEKQIEKTVRAYERVASEVAALRPETIIVTSPHTVMYTDYFHQPDRLTFGYPFSVSENADPRRLSVRFHQSPHMPSH